MLKINLLSNLFDVIALPASSDDNLHLKDISFTHARTYDIFESTPLIKPEKYITLGFMRELKVAAASGANQNEGSIIVCININYLKEPVRSDTPGHRSVWASTFAPLLVSFRIRFHPCTPPCGT